MIITKTPYRISLFGGGSDHPKWFDRNGGKVISFSINKFCYITTRILPPFFEHRYRIAYSKIETVTHYSSIDHPVVRESIRLYLPEPGLEIHHDGDLPARSGIGSSSAFTVGMIHALLALRGNQPSGIELADSAIRMEQEILRENVGWQDQIACAVGGINEITFGTGKKWSISPIEIDCQYIKEIQSRMVLIFSGVQRISSEITSELLLGLDKKREAMQEVIQLATDCRKILDSRGDLDTIGEMLNYSWELKKQLNPSSSSIELDELYCRARSAGALGGKVLGAGGGGFMLFWVDKNGKELFLRNLGYVNEVPFEICFDGSSLIYQDNSQMGWKEYW